MCGGGDAAGFGGAPTIFIEPGATFEYEGGSIYLSYVKAGAHHSTASSGIRGVVYETGADVTLPADPPALHMYIECPSLTFDASQAPTPGCGE